jgi:serine protease Do
MGQEEGHSCVRRARDSLVAIYSSTGVGAGFFVHRDGIILTNKHCLGLADSFTIRLADDRMFVASFRSASPDIDIATLEVQLSDPVVVPVMPNVGAEEGETVFALGHPHGLTFTVTKGIVSTSDRLIDDVHYVQTDVAMNPGNSGGPLINARGELLGMNTMILQGAQGIGFAIAVGHLAEFMEQDGIG